MKQLNTFITAEFLNDADCALFLKFLVEFLDNHESKTNLISKYNLEFNTFHSEETFWSKK